MSRTESRNAPSGIWDSATYSKPINGVLFPPEVIQSFVLEKLKQDAQQKIGAFEKAVVTVPAYFNEPRRKATQDAGRLAGIDVVDIINEPTAAAIAFGFQQGFLSPKGESQQPETILVYDLGGGTFDVTLMQIDGTSYTARATAGDVYLGGVDWNQRLADYLAGEFQAKTWRRSQVNSGGLPAPSASGRRGEANAFVAPSKRP